jgi:hypothetical protein
VIVVALTEVYDYTNLTGSFHLHRQLRTNEATNTTHSIPTIMAFITIAFRQHCHHYHASTIDIIAYMATTNIKLPTDSKHHDMAGFVSLLV